MNITGPELLKIARAGRPGVHYRLSVGGDCIAAEMEGEWRRVAGKIIGRDEWFEMGDLLVNGACLPFEPDLTQ
jgi:hypothetical protein